MPKYTDLIKVTTAVPEDLLSISQSVDTTAVSRAIEVGDALQLVYADMHGANAAPILLGGAEVYEPVTGFDTNGPARELQPDEANNRIVAQTAGTYEIGFDLTAQLGLAGRIDAAIHINAGITNILSAGSAANDLDVVPLSATGFATLALANQVELWFKGDQVFSMVPISMRIRIRKVWHS